MTAKDILESIRKIVGAVVVFVVLPAVAIANSQWWLAAVVALVGIFLGGRALLPVLRQRRATAIARAEELTYRANQQNRWARRGDSMGVYGPAAAEIMRTIQPKLPKMPSPEIQPDVQIAAIADKPEGLAKMIAERTPGWRWAAFASVLVQRRAALQPRLRDLQLGFATPSGARARSGAEVARFITEAMDELGALVGQVESFMLAPAFIWAFGSPSDEATADADGVVHVANRLMDYHERFLALAERCRDFDAPSQYTGLMRDCCKLMNIPLDGYGAFIDDFVELIAEMPDLMIRGRGTLEAEPIQLHMSVDDQLLKRITKQVRAAAMS